MPEVSHQCRATTKSGERCQNRAQQGRAYCYIHRRMAQPPAASEAGAEDGHPQEMKASAPVQPRPVSVAVRADDDLLIRELDALVQELRRQIPADTPLAKLFAQQNEADEEDEAQPTSPSMELLIQLRDSILESSVKDLLDPATWQGFAYVAQVALQTQLEEAAGRWDARLSGLPAYERLRDLATNLQRRA